MPRVILPHETGFACSCPAWPKGRDLTPKAAIQMLIRSADVEVKQIGPDQWEVWTREESRYVVTRGQMEERRYCKHILAVLATHYPILRQAALGAVELLQTQQIKQNQEEEDGRRRKRASIGLRSPGD